MTHVTFLAIPDALGTSITIPLEMLNAANELSLGSRRARPLQLEIAGSSRRDMRLAGGLVLKPHVSWRQLGHSDLIFVPGLWRSPLRFLRRYRDLSVWLAERHTAGSTLCSIGTGSYFLAEAGLLNNRPATTHWHYFDDFAARYPAVKLKRERFITLADRLYCTGSVNAGRDLVLHLIEQLFDERVADAVAHQFTHELKRSYESLLLDTQQRDTHHDELIIRVQEWMQANFARDLRLQQVADRFKLSLRSLDRRFRAAANSTPLQYLQEVRIDQARQLLKKSNLDVAEISDRVGYHDHSYFSALFRRLNGVSPSQYRRLVRSKLFSVE